MRHCSALLYKKNPWSGTSSVPSAQSSVGKNGKREGLNVDSHVKVDMKCDILNS